MARSLGTLTPAEVEYIAEDTAIKITPNFQAGVFLFLRVCGINSSADYL